MYGFTTVDGFMKVNQSLEEMIKYLANEPSVGLFYVQQHVQNALPNLLDLKDKVVDRSRATRLHTEDLEDSIIAVRSMSECGLPIADGMIKDISRSLHLMSTSLPRKGVIQNHGWGETAASGTKMSPSSSYSSGSIQQDDPNSLSYLSSVFNSAKQKAASLRWSQHDSTPKDQEDNRSSLYTPVPPIAVTGISSFGDTIAAELPLSCHTDDHQNPSSSAYTVENYEQFTSEKEANLEKWLEEP